jgi:hypothetical protein
MLFNLPTILNNAKIDGQYLTDEQKSYYVGYLDTTIALELIPASKLAKAISKT